MCKESSEAHWSPTCSITAILTPEMPQNRVNNKLLNLPSQQKG